MWVVGVFGRLGSAAVLLAGLSAVVAVSASGQPLRPAGDVSTAISPNWAGYVVTADATTFTSITATWTQPRVTCTTADQGAAVSFWVGLGGSTPGARALEQAGTASDCKASGASTYRAWYEVVPDAPIETTLQVAPGDTITASVNMLEGGSFALFQLKNRTRRTAVTVRVPLASPPDLSSAEWIAEAPTKCAGVLCLPVPLEKFGSVSFSRIAALGNGIGGTLTHPGWSPASFQLVPSTVLVSGPNRPGPLPGAAPAGLTPDGSSFDVDWVADGTGAGGL
jgi:hypothetical protein